MKKSAKSVLGAATLSLGLALGVSSLSEAKPPKNVTPKLEGGKEGLASADMHKHNSDASAGCAQHKIENVSGQIKTDAKSAGYIKFDGIEGECSKVEGAAQHKVQGGLIKIEKQNSADIIKR